MFCIILRLTPNRAKQRTPTVLLLIPTVCCQDVTVPVRDKVAIILPPRSLSLFPRSDFKTLTLRLKTPASAELRSNV